MPLPLAIGRTVTNKLFMGDLAEMPTPLLLAQQDKVSPSA